MRVWDLQSSVDWQTGLALITAMCKPYQAPISIHSTPPGALAMKTLSKPLADRFKTWVMSHPQHRQTILRVANVRAERGAHGSPHVNSAACLNCFAAVHSLLPTPLNPQPPPTPKSPTADKKQVAHRMEVGITRKAEGKEGPAFIGSMTEEKSVELASKIASEAFLFAVGALLVFAEYDRNLKKDLTKRRREEAERQQILSAAREEREVGRRVLVGVGGWGWVQGGRRCRCSPAAAQGALPSCLPCKRPTQNHPRSNHRQLCTTQCAAPHVGEPAAEGGD